MRTVSVLSGLQKLLPGVLGSAGRPHGREVLTLRPLRQPTVVWERRPEDQLVILTVRRRSDWWTNFAARMFGIPSTRKIELTDEISSYVWVCCDGEHTVAQISDDISKRYKLNKRQSEVSVLTFLKTLQSKHLIGVPAAQAKSYKEPPAVKAPDTNTTFRKGGGYYAGRKRSSRTAK